MSITDVFLLLIVLLLAFISLKLHLISYSVDKIAGVSHYAQQNAFLPSSKVEKAKTADEPTKRAITDSTMMDISDLPDEIAMEALENWGTK